MTAQNSALPAEGRYAFRIHCAPDKTGRIARETSEAVPPKRVSSGNGRRITAGRLILRTFVREERTDSWQKGRRREMNVEE